MYLEKIDKLRRSKLAGSYLSLSSVTALNVLFPLILIPYLIHVLGIGGYGTLAFHQYLSQFALVLLDFGFPLYAVPEVARRTGDAHALSRFVFHVYMIKVGLLGLLAFGVIVLLLLKKIGFVAGISSALTLGFFAVATVNSFAPTWLFQGLERNSETVLPTLLARIATLISTFAIIRQPSDLALTPIPQILGAFVFLFILSWRTRQTIFIPNAWSVQNIQKTFKESAQVFWSRLAVVGYVTISPVLVSAAAGSVGVAVYNVCEKVMGVARVPFDTFSVAAYARFSRTYGKSEARKFAKILFGFAAATVAVMWMSLPFVGKFLHVPGLAAVPFYLSVFSVALLPIAVHGFLGTCVLLPNGRRIELGKSVIVGLLCYICTTAVLWNLLHDRILIAIISMVMVEFGVLGSRMFFSVKQKLI
jgi:O-antigen/teichoic acid export membrane protein